MTITTSPGFGFPLADDGQDAWPARPGWIAILAAIESKAVRYAEGLLADRPVSPAPNLQWREPSGRITFFLPAGGGWIELVPAGGAAAANHTHTPSSLGAVPSSRQVVSGAGVLGGGPLSSDLTLSVDFAGTGFSNRAARSDHTHPTEPAYIRWSERFLPEIYGGDSGALIGEPAKRNIWGAARANIPPGGVLVQGTVFFGTTANAACYLDIVLNGVFMGSERFHSHGRAMNVFMPFSAEGNHTGGTLTIALDVRADPLNSSPIEVREINLRASVR